MPGSGFHHVESSAASLAYVLPFDQVAQFPPLFEALDSSLDQFQVAGYGVTITSLEEVFLKVGGDHDLDSFNTQQKSEAKTTGATPGKDGSNRGDNKGGQGDPSLALQVYGLWCDIIFILIFLLFGRYCVPLLKSLLLKMSNSCSCGSLSSYSGCEVFLQ